MLHRIKELEFIDSPEFESSVTGDEKFQVQWPFVVLLSPSL